MKTKDIIDQLGGPASISRYCGISRPAVSLWVLNDRIPADRVPQLERLSREMALPIRAEDMRSDIDWAALRCNECRGD